MATKVAVTNLNASTIDILNVIRQNASYDYQQSVPTVATSNDIPKVGEVICGTPAFANQFINALVNRIALVAVQSATFNNPFAPLKKGYLEFGETVEDIFVSIANVVEFDVEKAKAREFQRTTPDVRSAFHAMNWRVMYPVTIQDTDLQTAFMSMDGVQNLIAKIVESVYTAAEYDEYLLFKYLLVKAIAHGKMYPVAIGDGTDLKEAGVKYRGKSNLLTFIKSDYNEAGVKTNTPKERQCIFMDAEYNASYDVNVLASAFNMGKAEYEGKLHLIDDWTTFDNDRFETIRSNSNGIEEVTADELALLKDVKAVLIDENWFQVYDNKNKFTEDYVSAGLYWNYFYHTWKTVSSSPFANAIVFVTDTANITLPDDITVEVTDKSITEDSIVLTLTADFDTESLQPSNVQYVQTEQMVTDGIAMHKYGAVLIPASAFAKDITVVATINGTEYTASTAITSAVNVGDTITLAKA